VSGELVMTSRIHEAYLLHMQDYLLNFAKHRPAIQHLNASRIGARVRGMSYVGLEETLGPLPAIDGSERAAWTERFSDASIAESLPATPLQRDTLDGWLAELTMILDQHPGSAFTPLYAAFAATSLHAQAATSYRDVQYVFEAKYQAPSAAEVYGNRFREHLRQVAADLRQIRSAL
jgi:hypothetical protein